MNNAYCVQFLNEKANETVSTATAQERDKFIESIKELHANGYYITRTQNGFIASNKHPHHVQKQMEDLPLLIRSTFERI